jgi:hypothetical protein
VTIAWWKISTMTDNYAWFPKGKELLMLDISLTTIFIHKSLFWLIVGNIGLFAIISSLEKKKVISTIMAGLTVLIFFVGGQWVDKQLAFSYFVIFNNQSVTEENIERPILESGYYIGEKLTDYINDKTAKNRRYAISGLGKIKYTPGIETLEGILLDINEPDFIRAEALEALRLFGTRRTEKIIQDFDNAGDKKYLHKK